MSLLYLQCDTPGSLALAGTRIPRKAFRVLNSAEAVWAEAAEAANRARQQGELDAAQLRELGQQQGLAEGRAEGVASVLATLEIEQGMRTLLAERIVALVEHCLINMLGSFDESELFRLRIQQLVKSSRLAGGARLRVCPSQAHLAAAAVADLASSPGGDKPWLTVVPDDGCGPDALVLETSVGFVDASLELTLQGVRDIIQRAMNLAVQGASS